MKKYNKFIALLFIMLFTLNITLPVGAENRKPLTVSFSDFKFITNDYNVDDVHVEYCKEGLKETAKIIDNNGKTMEIMSVQAKEREATEKMLRVPNVYPYTFTRSVSYGSTTVQLSMNVEIYSKGSFRSINSYQGGYVGIATSITKTRLEGSHHDVWSPSGFPTAELYYAFNGTIVAEVKHSVSVEVKAELKDELIGAGFSISGTDEETIYFRRSFDSTGTVELYH